MLNEFLQILCNLYIVAIAVILPLYVRGTYVMLGDDKYALFRSVSLFCLGLGIVAVLAKLSVQVRVVTHSSDRCVLSETKCVPWARESLKVLVKKGGFSPVDVWVMLYGGAVVISAMCSSYGATAWVGYPDWHMGAVSQLLFVGIYFFVSRCYRGDEWPMFLLVAAFFLVTVFGGCNRLGLDPLGLMHEFNSGDWEYSHLISTIGNINWFCGYGAVALAMPVTGYLKGKHLRKTFALYVISALGLLLLCIQGSDIGPVLVIVCLGICLLWSRGKEEGFGRTLLLAAGVAIGLPCYSWILRLCGEEALKSLPADGPGLSLFGWSGWWLIGIMCLGLYLFLHRFTGQVVLWSTRAEKTSKGIGCIRLQDSVPERAVIVRGLWLCMMVLGAAVVTVGGILYMWRLFGSQAWQSGRGALWPLALQGFWRGDWKQKLLGAGPDCFAEYIYSVFAPSELFAPEDHWENAIFANAHNQWLNHLVNIGLLGTGCAVGVAIAAARRYHGYLFGMLALILYGVNSLVSFQQVLNTSMFFVILGICEYFVRKDIERERETLIKIPLPYDMSIVSTEFLDEKIGQNNTAYPD